MTREQLEHLIRAAGTIAGDSEVVIIGSQAILGSYPDAPPALLVSMEADLYPLDKPERADLIDGTIGELSPFHETFGYYAHGVGPETAILPRNWRDRVVVIQSEATKGVRGLCLSPEDLAISKLLAGRGRDIAFVEHMFRAGLADKDKAASLADEVPPEDAKRLHRALSSAAH